MKKIISLFLCIVCIFTLSAPAFAKDGYIKIEKQEYYDKTLAGFLSQIVGFLSGYEYKSVGGRYVVGMPDDYFELCNGPYAGNTAHLTHVDKHIKNAESGIFEVWIDDDFGVDIFNQYILEDMYEDYGTVNSRAVSDGWLKYGIWDMGGGQRQVGAYGNISREYYLPQFAGNGEFGNMYSYLSEPYLATDTLGMNAGGMHESAVSLAEVFATVTGDRDNVEWAKLFAAMLSMAYFEKDVQTLIKNAAKVFPSGSYSASLVDEIFALYQKYPTWRDAFIAYEKAHYIEGVTSGANTTINCGFVLLTLLYGCGDYLETAKIGSLAGYDCESTTGIALSVLGIMNGTDILPDDVNALVWQNGKGVIVNRSPEGVPAGERMHADNLEKRMLIDDIVKKYVSNFEHVLKENGGYSDSDYYYIPEEIMSDYRTVEIANSGFENGNLDNFKVNGNAVVTRVATFGNYAAKLYGDTEIYCAVKGLTVGKKYALTAFIHVTDAADAFLFARDLNGGVCASVCTEGEAQNIAHASVKRTLTFTATSSEMEIGVRAFIDKDVPLQYVTADGFTLLEMLESNVGNVIIENKNEAQSYKMLYTFIEAKRAGEHLLKLSFSNRNKDIVDAKIIINGEGYAAAALYKTADTDGLACADTVYIPIVLEEGANRVSLSFDGYAACITDAALVDVSYR